ncbi:MAG: dTDP-4-dehydrorhamnose reductase [Hyphomonadaceae bacterium]|nr:dTDP-4-dehydrorhamnose reductase [Hyphomonadaceae bacterium]
MNNTRILTLGRSGQMAQALAAMAAGRSDIEMVCLGRPDIDLAQPESLLRAIHRHQPDIIINAAAYTNVDGAETETSLAQEANATAPRQLAVLAAEAGCPLIHLSTDCVFDGTLPRAYRPDDATHPLGAYGRSKLAGEDGVREELDRHLIVRISWIFSVFGSNFVTKMLELAQTRETLRVVSDQHGCPTYAPDLAGGLIEMALAALQPGFQDWGTYHLAGDESVSRHHMAVAVIEESLRAGGAGADVLPISTQEFGAPAQRPLNARIDSTRTEQVFGVRIEAWRENLQRCVRQLVTGETRT